MPTRTPGQGIRREIYRALMEDEYTRTRRGRLEVSRVVSEFAEELRVLGIDGPCADCFKVAIAIMKGALT